MKVRKRDKLVFGVGINDADYNVVEHKLVDGKRKIVWWCPFYVKWRDMICRCYSENWHKRFPSYLGCSVTNDWLIFSNFKTWMEIQDWKNKHLDKDILFPGNKIYGPETCVFIDKRINYFVIESNAGKGGFPIGVYFDKSSSKFSASCRSVETNKQQQLGYFATADEAHRAWLAFKLQQACILASKQTDKRVAEALISRYTNYISLI